MLGLQEPPVRQELLATPETQVLREPLEQRELLEILVLLEHPERQATQAQPVTQVPQERRDRPEPRDRQELRGMVISQGRGTVGPPT